MGRPGKGDRERLIAAAVRTLALLAAALWGQWSAAEPAPAPSPETMAPDATLRDVCFVDPRHGWAVGDRGVIWATLDGGRNWHRQASPVGCTLTSVHFLDSQTGWAVGGWVHPYTHRTTGVVLRTRNGGQRWLATPGLSLPRLTRVKFHDLRRGWAIGASSALYPSGLFRTDDGGRSWRTAPAGSSESLLTGDFLDHDTGAVAGRDGELQVVRGAAVRPSRTASVGRRSLNCLRLSGPDGWLAGDQGLLMRTADGGHSWSLAGPPAAQAELFDFQGVALQGPECWVVVAPGTIVFHSRDNGRSWRALRTGQSLPLRAVHFVDTQRGWAVGELGAILATVDGGQSWRTQRAGGRRAALLGVFTEADRVPWEVLVRLAGDEGYLTAVETLGRRDLENPGGGHRAGLPLRLSQAALQCGASHCRLGASLPLRQRGIELDRDRLLRLWRQLSDEDPLRQLESSLVRSIRQWRPDVVVADEGGTPLARLASQAVLSAAAKAADPTSHSLQLTAGGLAPWQVRKVFLASEVRGTRDTAADAVAVLPAQLAPRLGASLGQRAAGGRALLVRQPQRGRPHQLRLAYSQLPRELAAGDVFRGLNLKPGGEARRQLAAPPVPLDVLTRRAQLARNTQAFVDRALQETAAGRLAGLAELTTELPPSGAAPLLYELSESFRRNGRLDLAADVLERLIQEHAGHALAEPATLQLIRYYTSGEDAWRRRSRTLSLNTSVAAERVLRQAPRASDIPAILDPRLPTLSPAATATVQATTAAGHDHPSRRRRRALELAAIVQRSRPALHADPELRFALAAAERVEGSSPEAEKFYESLARGDQSPWGRRAATELWLNHGQGRPPLAVTHCDRGPLRPHLDGRLDDELWRQATRLELHSAEHDDGLWPAAALIAWDQQHLYWAASCRRPADVETARGPAGSANHDNHVTRRRDDDLGERDRVVLRLDVDRDYATAFQLTVDDRGWGGDRCLDDASWDPQWHIAARQEGGEWYFEAAIPWTQLARRPPRAGDAWAVDVHRVLPDRGIQSWTTAATVDPGPQGFGLIVFRQ